MTAAAPAWRVGFVGLGDQGAPMARAIAEAGFTLVVWARRPSSLEVLADVPHEVVSSLRELGASCDVVGVCVTTEDDVNEVLFDSGLVAAMRSGAAVAVHSTISPFRAIEFAQRALEHEVVVLDAPVSGGGEGARRKSLLTVLGGDEMVARRFWPVFQAYSAKVVYVGPEGSGQTVKLLNNALLLANLRNAAVALATAYRLRFDLPALIDVLQAGSGGSSALSALHNQMSTSLVEHHLKVLEKDLATFGDLLERLGVSGEELVELAEGGLENLTAAVSLPGVCRLG